MEKWQDPSLSLGERCVVFAENELKNKVKEDKVNSFTSPRIREYFTICKRRVTEVPLGLTSGNWCAAAVSFCLKNSLLDESPPHGYRAGAIEIEAELKDNKLWRSAAQARLGSFKPQKGDIVIFDRSNASNPSSIWWRHIGFYYDGDDKGFRLISGNNGGTWKIDSHTYDSPKLLGFGEYPSYRPIIIETVKGITAPTEFISDKDLIPKQTENKSLIQSILDLILKVFGNKNE